jgi:hypothetical protein
MLDTKALTTNTQPDTRLVRMVRDPFTNEMIPSPTLIQEIRTVHADISSMRLQLRVHNESSLLMVVGFILGAVCVALVGATATVHDATYVVFIACVSSLAFVCGGIGAVSIAHGVKVSRRIKNAQRKLAQLIQK